MLRILNSTLVARREQLAQEVQTDPDVHARNLADMSKLSILRSHVHQLGSEITNINKAVANSPDLLITSFGMAKFTEFQQLLADIKPIAQKIQGLVG